MRSILAIAALAVGLLGGAARAGVYDLDDPMPTQFPPLPFDHDQIRQVLDPLQAAAIPIVPEQPPEQLRKLADDLQADLAVLGAKLAELQTKLAHAQAQKADDLRAELADVQAKLAAERLKLGACLLRLGRPTHAISVLGQADDNDYRVRLYRQTALLEAKNPRDWSTPDRINLGACYMRLNRPNDAIRVLSEADQTNFLVLANLAAAYQAVRELDRAVAYESQALDAWPTIQAGWSGEWLRWYRRVEGYSLKLLQSRLRESQANPPNKAADALDPIFDPPRRPGEYEAPIQAWKLWGDLPSDAYDVVAQLLIWSPGDPRLYWQLGELLSSKGYVQDAAKVFEDLSFTGRLSGREFAEHRQVLKDARAAAAAVMDAIAAAPSPERFQMDIYGLAWALTPRGMLRPPGGGDLAAETAAAAAAARAQAAAEQAQQPQQPQPPAGPAPPRPPPPGWLIDWRPLAVGFAAGLIVAGLGALQWAEWRRRRAATRLPPRPEPAVHDAGAFRTDAPAAHDRVERMP